MGRSGREPWKSKGGIPFAAEGVDAIATFDTRGAKRPRIAAKQAGLASIEVADIIRDPATASSKARRGSSIG